MTPSAPSGRARIWGQHGVPMALKDIFATRGCRVTNGSKIYAESVPDADAAVVARLRAAGAIFMGSLNLYQFACGSVAKSGLRCGAQCLGYDTHCWWLGSGSGTAVAADLCFGTLGTDTGGSIRVPATLNGLVGLKPTYGRVRHIIFPSPGLWTMPARSAKMCGIRPCS